MTPNDDEVEAVRAAYLARVTIDAQSRGARVFVGRAQAVGVSEADLRFWRPDVSRQSGSE